MLTGIAHQDQLGADGARQVKFMGRLARTDSGVPELRLIESFLMAGLLEH